MKVYIVCVSDIESTSVKAICTTKEIAKREVFKARDELVKEWQESISFWEKKGRDSSVQMYQRMIDNLKSDNWEEWDNSPQECPYFYEMKLMEV